MNVTDEETAAIRSNDLSSAFLLVARFLEPSGPKLRGVVYREEFDRPTQSHSSSKILEMFLISSSDSMSLSK